MFCFVNYDGYLSINASQDIPVSDQTAECVKKEFLTIEGHTLHLIGLVSYGCQVTYNFLQLLILLNM
jgi:hypothetical protein